MVFYCCHKFGGNEDIKLDIEQKIRTLQMNDCENTYISPVHAFGFMYHDFDYNMGMEFCYDLLTVCDELIVLSELSEGVKREIAMAKKINMPIRYLDLDAWKQNGEAVLK